jgi:hypothetical protein
MHELAMPTLHHVFARAPCTISVTDPDRPRQRALGTRVVDLAEFARSAIDRAVTGPEEFLLRCGGRCCVLLFGGHPC